MRLLLIIFFYLPVIVIAQEARESTITIERGPCIFGCPTYSMTVFSDGTYFWFGGEHVRNEGAFRGKLAPEAFNQAMRALSAAHYDEFKDQYEEEGDGCQKILTDQPMAVLYIQTPSSIKKISHYLGCRGFNHEDVLEKLEAELDEIFGTKNSVHAR